METVDTFYFAKIESCGFWDEEMDGLLSRPLQRTGKEKSLLFLNVFVSSQSAQQQPRL